MIVIMIMMMIITMIKTIVFFAPGHGSGKPHICPVFILEWGI